MSEKEEKKYLPQIYLYPYNFSMYAFLFSSFAFISWSLAIILMYYSRFYSNVDHLESTTGYL